uniref:Glycoprotein Xg n=1 Tax=Panthera tigris altaica TaxID=74533 RepID=A0A8C9J608_PANTA
MERRGGLFWVAVLGFVLCVQGQRDFDLADALDDPEPTKKPSSDIYPRPKPPYHPQPGMPDNSGGIYPRPRPPPRPQPGGSDSGGGNTIAKIVSPIVSVLVVMLVGAATGWFQRNRRRNCFRTREPEHV